MPGGAGKLRIDKWLWQARFFKTRSLSAKAITSGGCRINGALIAKPATAVTVGDVLTFAQGPHIRVIEVLQLGTRRGPAPEAQLLYSDLDPPKPRETAKEIGAAPKFDKGGRPTKRDRRAMDAMQRDTLE